MYLIGLLRGLTEVGPATFQCLMMVTFHDQLGQFIHAYLNDVFAYSSTIEVHEEHLGVVFGLLRKFRFYLEIDKCDLYAERMDRLGYLSTKNLSMPKGRARKLISKYIGPIKVVEWHTANDMYTLNLPDQLKA